MTTSQPDDFDFPPTLSAIPTAWERRTLTWSQIKAMTTARQDIQAAMALLECPEESAFGGALWQEIEEEDINALHALLRSALAKLVAEP